MTVVDGDIRATMIITHTGRVKNPDIKAIPAAALKKSAPRSKGMEKVKSGDKEVVMLEFKTTPKHYVITEKIMAATETYVKAVKYSKDLMTVQVNNDPPRPTTYSSRVWFENVYRRKFEEAEEQEAVSETTS